MIDLIRDMLRTPDAQSDPYSWAATLLAHAWIGVALAVILPWWAALGGYAVWETVQWARHDADPWDCLLDWCAVAFGVVTALCLIGGYDAAGAVCATLIVAAAGVWRRYER